MAEETRPPYPRQMASGFWWHNDDALAGIVRKIVAVVTVPERFRKGNVVIFKQLCETGSTFLSDLTGSGIIAKSKDNPRRRQDTKQDS
jgi:hypothetical protein